MNSKIARLTLVWATLIGLLALTVAMAFLPLGSAKAVVGYVIATGKAALVFWFFMDMRRTPGLPRLAAMAGLVWVSILLILLAADVITRS